MNTSWAIGFIVGILIVAAVSVIAARVVRKNGAGKGTYDERQQIARGRAFTWAYTVLLIYLALWMVLRSLEIPFFMEGISVMAGVFLSIAVCVGYSIFHDAYFKASESPRVWIGIICAAGLLNLGIGIGRLFRGKTIVERLYDNANLLVGALLVVVLACIVIKRAMDRRAGEE
ncbi:MAG: hypothetical protein Q4C10_00535 [Clostridia bacterium]|nr:hypothetical protein [Clostridia bacterium]